MATLHDFISSIICDVLHIWKESEHLNSVHAPLQTVKED